jgi:hypothetical protein
MEYVRQRGTYSDLPFEEIFASFAEVYPTMVDPEGAGDAVTPAHDDPDFAP